MKLYIYTYIHIYISLTYLCLYLPFQRSARLIVGRLECAFGELNLFGECGLDVVLVA